MTTLVAILWIVYFSDCFAKTSPDSWVFRGLRVGGLRPSKGADIEFLGGRLSLVWLSVWPWAAAVQASGESFDIDLARGRLSDALGDIRALRVASAALFGLVLVALSVLVVTDRLIGVLWLWLPAALVAWVATVVLFLQSRKRAAVPPSWESAAAVVLSPLTAIRSPLVILAPRMREFHPVCVAAVTCSEADFLRVARLWHFDAPDLRESIRTIADTRGLAERLTAPPDDAEAGMTRYCPRCYESYQDTAAACSTCLVPLESRAAA
jgi:hypothetical protein